MFARALYWTVRLIPAVTLFSVFFALDGGLRWIGLFGLIPFALAFSGLPGCACAARGTQRAGFRSWPCF